MKRHQPAKRRSSKKTSRFDLPPLPTRQRSLARPLPQTPSEWLAEIQDAWLDAGGAKPFGPMVGMKITDAQLFHVAPLVALKFRGKGLTGKLADSVREAALSTYVANFGPDAPKSAVRKYSSIAFALCYVVSHVVLGCIDEGQAQDIMMACESEVFVNKSPKRASKRSPATSRRLN